MNSKEEAHFLIWKEGIWSFHSYLTRLYFHAASIIIRFPVADLRSDDFLFKIIKSRWHALNDDSCEPIERDLKYCFETEEFSLLITHPDQYIRELGFFLQQNVAYIKTHLIV
jgi:hypothetical protein